MHCMQDIADSTPTLKPPSPSPGPSAASGLSDISSGSTIQEPTRSTYSGFKIPENWRPSIKACLSAQDDLKKRQLLTDKVRNEIVRDLVTTMYTYQPTKPSKEFCTKVAKMLVYKYPFLKDYRATATGYVSTNSRHSCLCNSIFCYCRGLGRRNYWRV